MLRANVAVPATLILLIRAPAYVRIQEQLSTTNKLNTLCVAGPFSSSPAPVVGDEEDGLPVSRSLDRPLEPPDDLIYRVTPLLDMCVMLAETW